MEHKKRILAVIPARAGSKRLPGKNKKIMAGKPLIQWTIDAALNSQRLDRIMVSTDDEDILEIAKKANIDAPFLRPDSLSQDTSTTIDVLLHAIKYYETQGYVFDFVLLLQPTSPLRNAKHINEAIELLEDEDADAIISVCKAEHSPMWSNTLPADSSMESFLPTEIKNKRSQDLPDYFRLNGCIYLIDINRLRSEKTMFLSSNMYAYKMPSKYSVDIDEEIDFMLAEYIMKSEEKNV